MSTFGQSLRVSIFGQSHSDAIGCVIEGFPAGFAIDFDALNSFMKRRAPGYASWSTPRKEADELHFLSGLNEKNRTCGAPIALLINNTNTRSSDYAELYKKPRPGHADLTAQIRWAGEQDVRGGGHFSGRLTAPLVAAGGICLQLLQSQGIDVYAHLASVGDVYDSILDTCDLDINALRSCASKEFPTLDDSAASQMIAVIEEVHNLGDSIGGCVECAALGVPSGIGSYMTQSVESLLSSYLFAIPAVKAVEFGDGVLLSHLRGSESNDAYTYTDDGCIALTTNHCGGVLGGITTGSPLMVRTTFKPTSSIALEQHTVDLSEEKDTSLSVQGRHDPCVAVRAVPVVEAVVALGLMELMIMDGRIGTVFDDVYKTSQPKMAPYSGSSSVQ